MSETAAPYHAEPFYAPPAIERERLRRAMAQARAWIEATDRIAANPDFRTFIFGILDDFGLLDRSESARSEFSQGVDCAAKRIANRLLESPRGAELMAEYARSRYAKAHERLAAERKRNQEQLENRQ